MEFIIEHGKHYSKVLGLKNKISKFFKHFILGNEIEFSFIIKNNPKYEFGKNEDNIATNKLFGFSDNWHHHKDSFRLGWRATGVKYSNYLELRYYQYIDGKRYSGNIDNHFLINVKHDVKIKIEKYNYIVTIGNQFKVNEFKFARKSWVPSWFLRYRLYPYFGGNQTAPKEMVFEINY